MSYLTREQLQANIDALEKQGASPKDIQGYLDSQKTQGNINKGAVSGILSGTQPSAGSFITKDIMGLQPKSEGFLGSLFQNTIGSRGAAGVGQDIGGALTSNLAQQGIMGLSGIKENLTKSADFFIERAKTEKDPERRIKLLKQANDIIQQNAAISGQQTSIANEFPRVNALGTGGKMLNAGLATVGGEAVPEMLSKTLGGKIISAGIQGAKTGSIVGGGSGLAGGLIDKKTAKQTAIDTALGSAFGGITGFGLGTAFAGLGALANKSVEFLNRNQPESIVKGRAKELQRLVDSYSSVRNVVESSKKRGVNPLETLSKTDLLVGAVDETGTIRTQKAISELNQFIKPQEDVVSSALKLEGNSLPLIEVKNKLEDTIKNAGFEGGALTRALKNVDEDIAGYIMRVDSNGNLPLDIIHRAKVDKYANINYFNPESKRVDKVIAKTLKKLVEDNTKSVDVKALNTELQSYYSILNLLEKLDGKKAEGGRLGKYFAQTVGSIVGSHFGPIGSIIGAEMGGRLKGASMAKTFGGEIGSKLEQSPLMKSTIERNNYLNKSGSLNASQRNTINPTINVIDSSLPQTTEKTTLGSLDKFKNQRGFISTGSNDPLLSEARKYKSAEEFKQSITPKQLREFLNQTEGQGKTASSRATGATKRQAGDYLYSQDRGAFDALLDDIKMGRNPNDSTVSQLTDLWNKANKGGESSVGVLGAGALAAGTLAGAPLLAGGIQKGYKTIKDSMDLTSEARRIAGTLGGEPVVGLVNLNKQVRAIKGFLMKGDKDGLRSYLEDQRFKINK